MLAPLERLGHRSTEVEIPEGSVVMTTSHENGSLEEALTFLVRDALPSEPWAANCQASIVAVIGSDHWASEVRRMTRGFGID